MNTSPTMQDDQKYLSDLTAICEQKVLASADRQKLWKGEIEAVMKAIEIIPNPGGEGEQ